MDLTPQDIWTLRNIIVRAVTDCQEVLSGAARRAKAAEAKPPGSSASSPAAVPAWPLPPPEPRLAYSVQEAADGLNLSRSTLYKLIKQGDLQVLHIGGRTLIEVASMDALLARARS
jgi:excisionase family DNA binding protein